MLKQNLVNNIQVARLKGRQKVHVNLLLCLVKLRQNDMSWAKPQALN